MLKNNAAAGEAGSALRERSRRCGDTRSRWNSVRCAGLEEGPEEGRLDRGRVKPAEGCWVLWTWDRGVDNAYESGFDRLGKVPRPGVRSTEAARMLTKRGEEGCRQVFWRLCG